MFLSERLCPLKLVKGVMGIVPIADYETYSEGMKKSIRDKLFFEGLVHGVDTVIDYGCADGQVLKQINTDFPEWELIGIDADIRMVEAAQKNFDITSLKHKFLWASYIPKDLLSENITKNAILNLSSVIHEVYSYLTPEQVKGFWESVFNLGAKYISIRDLMLSESAFRDADINDVAALMSHDTDGMLKDFCSIWGNISQQNNVLHFLMKYRYKENWEREVAENYFPITIEQMLSMIPTDKYRIVYFEHYILPYNRTRIQSDYGIELHDNTHVKILLERK